MTYSNRAVERVVSMLDVLQESAVPMSLVEVHRAADLAKATAFRYLWTLERHGYVERDVGGGYRLGRAVIGLQSRDLDVLTQRARPWLEKLRDETGETVNLGVLDGEAVRYVAVAQSPRQVRVVGAAGDRDALSCTGLGKAIAAHLPAIEAGELLDRIELPRRTAGSITSARAFLDELDLVRRRARAVDDRENEEDARCVAVAITGSRIPAALSLSAPAGRLPLRDVPRIARALTFAAERL